MTIHVSPTNYRLLAAQQEPHKMPVPLTNAGEFSGERKGRTEPLAET